MEILVAEDSATVLEGLVLLLESEGYVVRSVADGAAALSAYRQKRPDLLLLDVMMPKKSGYAVCEEIRQTDKETPIIFLTAKDGDVDEFRGLSLGADDYVSKTASDAVLLKRIALAARRVPVEEDAGAFTFGRWRVEAQNARLVSGADGTAVELSLKEVEMLRLFHTHPDELLSRDYLLTKFWGRDYAGNESALSVMMSRLREKLGASGSLIATVFGKGYRFQKSR